MYFAFSNSRAETSDEINTGVNRITRSWGSCGVPSYPLIHNLRDRGRLPRIKIGLAEYKWHVPSVKLLELPTE